MFCAVFLCFLFAVVFVVVVCCCFFSCAFFGLSRIFKTTDTTDIITTDITNTAHQCIIRAVRRKLEQKIIQFCIYFNFAAPAVMVQPQPTVYVQQPAYYGAAPPMVPGIEILKANRLFSETFRTSGLPSRTGLLRTATPASCLPASTDSGRATASTSSPSSVRPFFRSLANFSHKFFSSGHHGHGLLHKLFH